MDTKSIPMIQVSLSEEEKNTLSNAYDIIAKVEAITDMNPGQFCRPIYGFRTRDDLDIAMWVLEDFCHTYFTITEAFENESS